MVMMETATSLLVTPLEIPRVETASFFPREYAHVHCIVFTIVDSVCTVYIPLRDSNSAVLGDGLIP